MRKRRIVGRIYRMKYSWKGRKDRKRRQEQSEKEWASSVGLCQKGHKPRQPTTYVKASLRDHTHTHVRAYTHARTHKHTRTRVHTHMHLRVYTHTGTKTRACARTHPHTQHPHIHTHKRAHTLVSTHANLTGAAGSEELPVQRENRLFGTDDAEPRTEWTSKGRNKRRQLDTSRALRASVTSRHATSQVCTWLSACTQWLVVTAAALIGAWVSRIQKHWENPGKPMFI